MYKFDNPNYVPTVGPNGPDVSMLILDVLKSTDTVLKRNHSNYTSHPISKFFNKK